MEYKIIEKWHLYPPGYSDQQKNPHNSRTEPYLNLSLMLKTDRSALGKLGSYIFLRPGPSGQGVIVHRP